MIGSIAQDKMRRQSATKALYILGTLSNNVSSVDIATYEKATQKHHVLGGL